MGYLAEAIAFFLSSQEDVTASLYGQGHINETWLVKVAGERRYVLQRLNPHVFAQPAKIDFNLVQFNQALPHARQQAGHSEVALALPQTIAGPGGETLYRDETGTGWRLLNYIGPNRAMEQIESAEQAEELGRGLGIFHDLVATMASARFSSVLPDLHHTPRYLQLYRQLQQANRHALVANESRAMEAAEVYCAGMIKQQLGLAEQLAQSADRLTHCLVHGDPKVSNFLFTPDGQRVIGLVDLDTLQPGLLLHDIADALRACCHMGGEAEKESLKLGEDYFNPIFFQSWLQGYLNHARPLLCFADRDFIVTATRVIIFELGVRFFTDHLAGDRYFKVAYPGHNLKRALAQFHQLTSLDAFQDSLEQIVVDAFSHTA